MEKRQVEEAKAAEALALQRKLQKEARVIIKVGKPTMARSQKEKLDRKKQEVKILTTEQKDRLTYLEMA